jgi:DNA-binding NarL/FixJ family response regulator
MPPRLLIVDDNVHFLGAARGLLDCEGMTVVGVATTSADALRLAAELQPDVTLVDIDLGEESGFDLARSLMAADFAGGRQVILTSAYPEEDFAELINTSPAIAFLPKSDLSASAIGALMGRLRSEADPDES